MVALKNAAAYSNGVVFELLAAARGLSEQDTHRLFHEQHHFGGTDAPPDAFLRVGVELAGGNRVSNLTQDRRLRHPEDEPQSPVFMHHGGGGGSGGRTHHPESRVLALAASPPGPLRVFVEWPALDVSLSGVELDARRLLEAAAQSRRLWPA